MPDAKLIASQHPPTSANGQINFMKMLFCVADAVFDIRSEVDMTKADAVSYLPRLQDKKVVGPIEVVKNSYRDYSNILWLLIKKLEKLLYHFLRALKIFLVLI